MSRDNIRLATFERLRNAKQADEISTVGVEILSENKISLKHL